jgi:hypothetical protein
MAVSYNEGNLAYMRQLAKEQGISLAELTRRRRLDEEHNPTDFSGIGNVISTMNDTQDQKEHMKRIQYGSSVLYPGEAADRYHASKDLGLTAAVQGEFEPVFTESATEAAQHQDTSHIGAEERAAGSAIGSAAGAILGGIVAGPVGASAGAAVGKAIGGGGSMTDAATGAIGSGGSKYATEAAKKKPGDKPVKDEMTTKIQGVLN